MDGDDAGADGTEAAPEETHVAVTIGRTTWTVALSDDDLARMRAAVEPFLQHAVESRRFAAGA